MRSVRAILWIVPIVGAFAAGAWLLRSRGPRNLILIDIDTLRADHLGIYGYERDTSPNLDRLARQSVRFAQAVSQAPNTPPSQMSIMTSLYYSVHGVTGNGDRLPDERVTLAELLKQHGFATWGFADGGYLAAVFGFAQGFDHYDDRPLHLARILANVERWLDKHSARRFFLFIHCYDVHSPYNPPPPFATMFEKVPYTGDFVPTNENLEAAAHWRRRISPADLAHVVALYDGGIRYVDDLLGKFFSSLERRGLLGTSIVIVLSDHGEEFKEHGSMLDWQTFFMPNLHVPLIIYVPGLAPRVVRGPVELVDVLPTALELLGLPPHPDAMGRSLVPLMYGLEDASKQVAYAEPFTFKINWRTVVSDRYQLRYNLRTGAKQLFDIYLDPLERKNVAAAKPEVVARLMAALRAKQARIEKAKRAGAAGSAPAAVNEETRKQLRALGYAGH